jgi:Xaa-Pro dipeptidase
MSINEGDPTVLRSGMVFHLIPDMHIPGEGGFAVSDTVAITETGREVLTKLPLVIFRR